MADLILSAAGTVTIPAISHFNVHEYLYQCTKEDQWFQISNLLSLTERDIPETRLSSYILTKNSRDWKITHEVDIKRVHTKFWHLAYLLSRHDKGELKILLDNGFANVFYINHAGDTRVVEVYQHWERWYFAESLIKDDAPWGAGNQFFFLE